MHSFNTLEHRLEALKKIINKHPEGVVAQFFGSTLIRLAHFADQKKLDMPLKAIITVGENISDAQRAHIEKALETKLFVTYGTNELGRLGFECEKGRLHINEERVYIEITDDAGRQLPDGTEGRVIFTNLDNRVMPLIRYDVGDFGTINPDPCPCRRTLRTLLFKGRQLAFIDFKDGRRVSLLDISSAFDDYWDAVHHYQLARTGELDFELRIVPGPKFDERKDRLAMLIARLLHPSVQLKLAVVEAVETAASGKAVYYKEENGPYV